MKPSREDLRVPIDPREWGNNAYRPVTEDDLREMGYVMAGVDFNEHRLDTVARNLGYLKLDVDVVRLRDAVNYNKQHVLADVARQVLAALDGGKT